MKRLGLLLLLLVALLGTPLQAAPRQGEYVIIVGGVSLWQWEKYKAAPHDNWWMNFVRASRIRTQQIQAEDPNAQITWLVFRPSYVARAKQENNDLLGHIASVRDTYKIKLIYFDKTQQVIDYLNAGQPRDQVKITNLEFFGHSNKACWMFDYSANLDSSSKVWLHENDLKKINRNVFARDAFVKSWGCHSGESYVKKWRSAMGIPMIGAIGKTQYMTDELPILSTAGGRWVK